MLWDDNLGFPGSPGKGFIKESGMIRVHGLRVSGLQGSGFKRFQGLMLLILVLRIIVERLCQGLGVILEHVTKKLCRVPPVWSPPQDGAWGHAELPPRAHFGESCGW